MLKTILKWTVIGAITGCASYATFLIVLASAQTYATVGMFPPDLMQAIYTGLGLGTIYGLYKAGLRLYITD